MLHIQQQIEEGLYIVWFERQI